MAAASFFPLRGLKPRVNFCLQSFTNIWQIVTTYTAPYGKTRSLRLSDALELNL